MSYKEPRQTYSKRDFDCPVCSRPVKKGEAIWVDPGNKTATCIKCKPKKGAEELK